MVPRRRSTAASLLQWGGAASRRVRRLCGFRTAAPPSFPYFGSQLFRNPELVRKHCVAALGSSILRSRHAFLSIDDFGTRFSEQSNFTIVPWNVKILSAFHTTACTSQGLIYNYDSNRPPRLLVVQPRTYPQVVMKANLLEALRLASSLEELRGEKGDDDEEKLPPYMLVQSPVSGKSKRRKRVRADAYFGSGTIENVRTQVLAIDSQDGLDAIFVNAILTAVQQRNLERSWGKPVLDRVGLIIEIFGAHAETKEARLQVELAALNYKKSRLVRMTSKDGRLTFGMDFEAEVVSARGRGSGGGRGFISGAGETEIQLQRRRISERRDRILTMLKEVRRTRSLHREARKKYGTGGHGNQLPVIAVVGYTNAGKSSLVSALSRSHLYIDDKLFATLDPRSRSVTLPSGQSVILSDTVGFIADLPIQLVEAFHATLEEVVEADFLMHVIDSSAPNAEEQRNAVLEVLKTIGVSDMKMRDRMIEVWNKIDLASEPTSDSEGSKLDALECGDLSLLSGSNASEDISSEAESEGHDEETTIVDLADEVVESTEGNANGPLYTRSSWCTDGVPRIGISVREGTGLKSLLDLLDKKIALGPKPYAELSS
ncbi:hypothetical protein KP509_16G000200 [Ceratopteris richardii]|uniref:Hflx-type G domain-containing protein n=1 Tax=Ceratopteris richardii TaxID=49495 RepID=A0A8T2T0E6_CERRI|nr:hypothetical protein KP509_16G000200 [Ceratopteris richardii]